mmetsp:Transcript_51571/g.142800  ORF Transcript_51571/g.142800 Transcript_51571/m.142800 type:complete len:350 (-) Transcript_51571:192-1241(-)
MRAHARARARARARTYNSAMCTRPSAARTSPRAWSSAAGRAVGSPHSNSREASPAASRDGSVQPRVKRAYMSPSACAKRFTASPEADSTSCEYRRSTTLCVNWMSDTRPPVRATRNSWECASSGGPSRSSGGARGRCAFRDASSLWSSSRSCSGKSGASRSGALPTGASSVGQLKSGSQEPPGEEPEEERTTDGVLVILALSGESTSVSPCDTGPQYSSSSSAKVKVWWPSSENNRPPESTPGLPLGEPTGVPAGDSTAQGVGTLRGDEGRAAAAPWGELGADGPNVERCGEDGLRPAAAGCHTRSADVARPWQCNVSSLPSSQTYAPSARPAPRVGRSHSTSQRCPPL